MNALILADIQNDFLPGGALPVAEGDRVVPVANALMPRFDLVVATQDWHPRDHGSFASAHPGAKVGDVIVLAGLPQILWPDHCVQDTPGADFAPGLDVSGFDEVFRKGADPAVDSYSGFFDNTRRHPTGLHAWLGARGVTDLYLAGLATDYCVKATALDAVRLGYRVSLVLEGCRGVNVHAGDVERAVEEMKAADVRVVPLDDVPVGTGDSR